MNNILLGILGYILLQLFLGVVVSKKVRSETDFLLAGRKLGFMLATFSIFATWFGAESCVGTAGAAYADGLAGVTADPFGYSICLLLMGLVFAVPLWNMKLTTIADFFRRRFSLAAERITALLMVPTSLLWAAAQIRAFGQVLSASSQMELTVAITIAAIVVICYTALGGLLADAITDIIQGIVLIAGLMIVSFSVIGEHGGIGAAITSVAPQKLSFIPIDIESGPSSIFTIAEAWAIPICGSVVAQEVISRVIASRTPNIARGSSLMASWLYFCVGLIPLFIGLIGFTILPNLEDPEHILPLMAQQHLSRFLYIVFAGALVSAILSTVDSALLAASALFSHNLVFSLRPQTLDKHRLTIVRSLVIIMGVLAYLLALHAEGIYRLVKDASSFGSAGIFVVLVFGLFTRFGSERSAVAALIAGASVWIIFHYFFAFKWSYILSLSLAFACYIFVAFAERLVLKFSLRFQDT
ncbi:MAG: sodium:solute symporter family protein [candidate division KSB1 bacterium]|nr:sodium:solute symporter family protein [candidate division KSB1 bacterium]MDZ7335727.1 sodium:solute symporter family protein [candidate division KSB1 bacterium]MDZ7357910.1 sodium:solute symporter family protein [candidate division KSB1 bacterium]MDZ7376903.1 sodium:solute symporter family protein [candidate division KSB1 bacterium]MDZ7401622.1 sodium:solute symporter family protein [candidate division KSB1 bacterium]